jgi:hypothetical protein
MRKKFSKFYRLSLILFLVLVPVWPSLAVDPLPSWNEGATKQAIVAFVTKAKKEIPEYDRIAVFDHDGTLWAEQPIYFQFAFALDRLKALAPQHPEWKTQEPFRSVLTEDIKGLEASGKSGLLQVLAATHAGMTTEEFNGIVAKWLKTARHPRFKKPYTDLVYKPMVELLHYLRDNGFKTFIVSGGGVEFMRVFTEKSYGIPPEQVVGSIGKLKFEMLDGKPVLLKLPEINFIDDGAGKPVGIQTDMGRYPVAAFGNSDGDLQMLQWVTAGPGLRFGLIVHHTDAEREWAYDRESHIGRLDKALDEAQAKGWTVVDMQKDWKTIFIFEQ